jgi:hypothetical protein
MTEVLGCSESIHRTPHLSNKVRPCLVDLQSASKRVNTAVLRLEV